MWVCSTWSCLVMLVPFPSPGLLESHQSDTSDEYDPHLTGEVTGLGAGEVCPRSRETRGQLLKRLSHLFPAVAPTPFHRHCSVFLFVLRSERRVNLIYIPALESKLCEHFCRSLFCLAMDFYVGCFTIFQEAILCCLGGDIPV